MKNSIQGKVYVAGHRGLVGSAISRELKKNKNCIVLERTRAELDLTRQGDVENFFATERPDFVFLAAAKVGGIGANDRYRGDFILENLQIQTNVIYSAFKFGVKKLLFLGSSCVYPKLAPQPLIESSLLSGYLEPTNEAYAVAKISGIMLCQSLMKQYGRSFISVMPTNVYGPGDRYHEEDSHVIPALILKFHKAKVQNLPEVVAWGTGKPLREFIFSEDLARACVHCMENYSDPEIINIGTQEEISILNLTEAIAKTVGYRGNIRWDSSRPDGTPRKIMDSSKMFSLGWRPKTDFMAGLEIAYQDFVKNYRSV